MSQLGVLSQVLVASIHAKNHAEAASSIHVRISRGNDTKAHVAAAPWLTNVCRPQAPRSRRGSQSQSQPLKQS